MWRCWEKCVPAYPMFAYQGPVEEGGQKAAQAGVVGARALNTRTCEMKMRMSRVQIQSEACSPLFLTNQWPWIPWILGNSFDFFNLYFTYTFWLVGFDHIHNNGTIWMLTSLCWLNTSCPHIAECAGGVFISRHIRMCFLLFSGESLFLH